MCDVAFSRVSSIQINAIQRKHFQNIHGFYEKGLKQLDNKINNKHKYDKNARQISDMMLSTTNQM